MAFDNLLTDRQANASPGIISARVESLEQREDPLLILRLDADAIVAHTERPHATLAHCRDVHVRRFIWAVELDAVGDQVLKQLAELSRIALQHGQIVTGHLGF